MAEAKVDLPDPGRPHITSTDACLFLSARACSVADGESMLAVGAAATAAALLAGGPAIVAMHGGIHGLALVLQSFFSDDGVILET